MTTKVRTTIAALVATVAPVVCTFAAIDTTSVPSRTYTKVLTLTVEVNATLSEALASEGQTVSSFESAGYDKLVKTGVGTLTMNEDIQAFAGDIFVEAGTLAVTHKDGLGKRTTDSFVAVRSGATLRWSAAVTYSAKLIYYEGDGFGEDSGALVADDVGSTSDFWKNEVFVMTGNATVRALCTSKTPSLFKSAELYMNGHTNTCWFGVKGKQFNFGPKVRDVGVFAIKLGYVYLDAAIELQNDPSGTSKVILDSRDGQINFQGVSYAAAFWPICVNLTPSAFKVSADSEWPGALEIAQGASVTMTDNHRLSFGGGLTGGGGINISAGTLALGTANDDFAGALSVSGGTLELPTERGVCPGLVAGYSSDQTPAGYDIANEWKNLTSMPLLTNAVETTNMPRLGNAGVEIEGQTAGKQVYTYSGYIMNTNDVDETWAFLCNMKHRVDLRVGDPDVTLFANWDKYQQVRAARAVLHPGANRFVLKCWVNGAKSGRYTSLKDSENEVYPAFAVIRNVAQEKDLSTSLAADWEQITGDPGDGSLFRVATNSAEVVLLEGLGLVSCSVETIRSLAMSNGAMLKMEGTSAVVSNLTGVCAVVQTDGSFDGNSLVVIGDWTIPSADLAAGKMLESDVSVVFDGNARVLIDYAAIPHGMWCDLATSSAGISEVPSVVFSDGKERNFKAGISDDGNTLRVKAGADALKVILR